MSVEVCANVNEVPISTIRVEIFSDELPFLSLRTHEPISLVIMMISEGLLMYHSDFQTS